MYTARKSSFSQPEKLRSFIIKQKLIEYILGEDFHVEILKRSKPLFRFLSQNGGLSKEYIDLLWKHNEDIHESNKKTVFETLIELSRSLNSDNLDYIYDKIKGIPIERYDETTIDLLKEFVLNVGTKKSLGSTLTSLNSHFIIYFY